jgi:hypothetical protein
MDLEALLLHAKVHNKPTAELDVFLTQPLLVPGVPTAALAPPRVLGNAPLFCVQKTRDPVLCAILSVFVLGSRDTKELTSSLTRQQEFADKVFQSYKSNVEFRHGRVRVVEFWCAVAARAWVCVE